MRRSVAIVFWCGVLAHVGFSLDTAQQVLEEQTETNAQVVLESDSVRGRRGVIEEEKYYNIHMKQQESNINQPWIPNPLPYEGDPNQISITNEVKNPLPLYQTTEKATDKPTGRGARASNENWIKLPIPGRDELQRDQIQREQRDDILTPPQPSGDLINSRMPRVNFVTQNKALETSESRNDKDALQRATRTDEIRTEFVRPEEDRANRKPVYPRQAIYNQLPPDDSRKFFYDERYHIVPELYRRDPYQDMIDRRLYYQYGPRIDRFDDNYVPRKPKRIIYYAHLPEVVRTAPQVDMRHRYVNDPYSKDFEEDSYARNARLDYRFRNRYPYAPPRTDDRYRDLAPAGTVVNDKKAEKVTPTPILAKKDVPTNDVRIEHKHFLESPHDPQIPYYPNSSNNYLRPIQNHLPNDIRQQEDPFLLYKPVFSRPGDLPQRRPY